MPEVYTEENIEFYRHFGKGSPGESNINTKIKDSDLLNAREYYVSHTLKETFEMYGSEYSSIDSFRQTLTNGYHHLPIYHKQKKSWEYNGQSYDSNPVSTIPESGE